MKTEQGLAMKIIPILRMDCPTCIPVLENEIKKLQGVKETRGNYIAKTLKVVYDPNAVQLSQIENAIEKTGYQIAYKKYSGVTSKLKRLLRREKPSGMQLFQMLTFLERFFTLLNPLRSSFRLQPALRVKFSSLLTLKLLRASRKRQTCLRWIFLHRKLGAVTTL
jgi:copper chaperone CopZ